MSVGSDADDPDEGQDGYESVGDYDTAPEEDERVSGGASGRGRHDSESEQSQGDGKADSSDEEAVEDYLLSVVSKDSKGVCYEFAKTGKCKHLEEEDRCTHSHDGEDVARFKAAQLLDPSYTDAVNKRKASKLKPVDSGVNRLVSQCRTTMGQRVHHRGCVLFQGNGCHGGHSILGRSSLDR